MIFGKLWVTLQAQVNKLANFFWASDPIAQMQYEYDQAVEELKGGREGLAQYRALVEQVMRRVANDKSQIASLEARIKAYLQVGDRETAARHALDLQKAKNQLTENENNLKMHEDAYNNHLAKVKHAGKKLADIRDKITKYDAELKMSRAEAEMAELANTFNFDVTTDFGQIEQVIQDKVNLNRAKSRVAIDLSSEGVADIKREEAVEKNMAEQALREFETQMGMVTPESAGVAASQKELGPAQAETLKQS